MSESSGKLKKKKKKKLTLTCLDKALNPKSETLRFPWASRSKFSGCIKRSKKDKLAALSKTWAQDLPKKDVWQVPLSLGGKLPCCGSNQLHW